MDPTMDEMPADTGMEPEGAGFSVELYVAADGSMTVSVESEAEEAEQHGGDPTAGGTPVKSLKEALDLILTIVKNGGQVADAAGDEAFEEGFAGGEAKNPGKQFG